MKRIISLFMMICLFFGLAGCGENVSSSPSIIDYGDAESFEAALNAGENLEGKTVRIKVKEFHPSSEWGYNLWAGEHLNFVSSRNPDIKEGDEVVLKATIIESIQGSWKISYEKVLNAVDGDNTIYFSADSVSVNSEEKNNSSTDTSAAPVSQGKAEELDGTFNSNQYYEVVEEANYSVYSYTHMIFKVLAKQSVSIDGQMLAYSPEGSVIGKSSSDITLTEGGYNYFKFSFDADVSNATFEMTAKPKQYYPEGDQDAVEMVEYNVSGNDLFITFKQVSDNLGAFAKFKILLYNGDEIVGDEEGYFNVYADNLNGKDSTDVASLSVYGKTFDRIEYMFEP